MLALQLAMASLQVRWKVWRYEISRWILVASMLFFSVHYLLQMIHGLRAQGADVGAAFNILFYTPVAFAITLSIINIESTGNKVRRYCLRGMMAYILIAIVFVIGMFKSQSLHIGNMLYVMLGLFVASMAYFILIIRKETKARKQKLMENFGIDLIPYVRYSQASIILLYFAAGLLPVAILFFPSHNPQRVLRVGVEPVQIDLRGHLQIAVKNSVMPDPLAVITVHPLLGEEPHVSPPVFLDTVNPPVTQSVLYSQVFIYLGSAHGGNSQHEECGQYSSHIPNTCHSDVN